MKEGRGGRKDKCNIKQVIFQESETGKLARGWDHPFMQATDFSAKKVFVITGFEPSSRKLCSKERERGSPCLPCMAATDLRWEIEEPLAAGKSSSWGP